MSYKPFPGQAVKSSVGLFEHEDLVLLSGQKVRDLWAVRNSDLLILFATDRISAFDSNLPTPVPGKGIVLNLLSRQWFDWFAPDHENHLVHTPEGMISPSLDAHLSKFCNRIMVARRLKVIPVECIVRGYADGSAWKAYSEGKPICGVSLPSGLIRCSQLPQSIFTPTTKAARGEHDEDLDERAYVRHLAAWLADNQPPDAPREMTAEELAFTLKHKSLRIYEGAQALAKAHGIIIADTKFEFGLEADGSVVIIDELLTPDSSRFWPLDQYKPGRSQPSFDKQFVRDYLDRIGWDHQPPAPELPPEVVAETQKKYYQAPLMLFGTEAW